MSSLKYPIWIRDKKTGKIERIPYELMTHHNGRYALCPHVSWNAKTIDFFSRYHEYFELSGDDYVFLGKLNKISRLERHVRSAMWGAAFMNGGAAIFNFSIGNWNTGAFSAVITLVVAVTYLTSRRRRKSR